MISHLSSSWFLALTSLIISHFIDASVFANLQTRAFCYVLIASYMETLYIYLLLERKRPKAPPDPTIDRHGIGPNSIIIHLKPVANDVGTFGGSLIRYVLSY